MTEVVSYRNQSIALLCKSMGWFLYDNGPRHELKEHMCNFKIDKITLLKFVV